MQRGHVGRGGHTSGPSTTILPQTASGWGRCAVNSSSVTAWSSASAVLPRVITAMVTSMIAGVKDARRLSPEGQEDLRRRVVAAVADGMTQAEAARVFVVAPQSVSRWMAAWRQRGSKGLAGRRRGREQGEQKALSARQQRKLRYAVCEHTPATFGLDGLVWTRKAVVELIEARHGLRLSLPVRCSGGRRQPRHAGTGRPPTCLPTRRARPPPLARLARRSVSVGINLRAWPQGISMDNPLPDHGRSWRVANV
jgi:transposase